MRMILHILTRPEDELARRLIEEQRRMPEAVVEVVDLTEAPDYDALVDKIFASGSIQVW
jgi:hypothetical protein